MVVDIPMRLSSIAAIPLLLAASSASADLFQCDNTAPHRLTANVAGASRIVVVGKAGTLRVRGANQSDVTASGTACSSDRDFLERMRIEARREGSDVVVEAIIPEKTVVFGFHAAKLDLEVVVPAHLPVSVKDGSGSIDIRGVASVEVRDGSGEIEIRDVRGDVEVRDGSGSIVVAQVDGSVRISDGSGGIEVRDVRRDVIVENDGSGGIDVIDVRGDFIVESDGSGGIDYENVAGTVRIPKKKR